MSLDNARDVALATAVAHVILALVVGCDARRRGRPVGKWLVVTLVGGLLGVAAYLLSGDDSDADLPLDELVDRVTLD